MSGSECKSAFGETAPPTSKRATVPKAHGRRIAVILLAAGPQTPVVHGSFNDTVYVLPLASRVILRAVA